MAQRPHPSLRFADGGIVPGKGRGDKIPAKYEPGEFVVSNDMIADNPGLREQLSSLRAETLAARGKTVEEADAKALQYWGGRPSLRAVGGFGSDGEWIGDNRPVQPTGGGNTVSPSARLDALKVRAREAAAAKPPVLQATTSLGAGVPSNSIPYVMPPEPIKATTSLGAAPPAAAPPAAAPPTAAPRATAPSPVLDAERLRSAGVPPPTSLPLPPDQAAAYDASPEGRATKAQALKESRGYFQGSPNATPSAAPSATPSATPTSPSAGQRVANGLRTAGQVATTGAAVLAGGAAAKSLRDFGNNPTIQGVAIDQRQAGDSASSTQIPTGGPAAPPAQGYNFWTDSEAGRNIGNMANAVAPLGGVALAARVPGAASRTVGFADAAVTGLASGVRDERQTARAAPSTPGLRVRPEDTSAGPPALAAPTTADASAGVRRIDRPGQSPLFTNMPDGGLLGNDKLMGRGAISPQNMAAANNLAATDSLRSQGAAMGSPSTGTGIPAMAPAQHSGNSWEARNNLRNLEVGASSITNTPQWSRGSVSTASGKVVNGQADQEGKVAAYLNARAADTAARTGSDAGSVARTNAQASMFGSKMSADASKENSLNSLRGTMYSADATLGAKRMEMERSLRQQAMMGSIFQAAGGDPVKASRIAATYGIDGKSFQDMSASDQTRTQNNVKDARSTFENMFTRDGKNGPERDENAEALANNLAAKIVPGWENMNAEQRAANRTKVVDATRMVQGMNSLRNNSWAQKIGLDAPTPAYSQLPDLNGAAVTDVGLWESLTTPDVRSGDKKISLRDGGVRYLPQGQLSESQLRILQDNGAKRQ